MSRQPSVKLTFRTQEDMNEFLRFLAEKYPQPSKGIEYGSGNVNFKADPSLIHQQ